VRAHSIMADPAGNMPVGPNTPQTIQRLQMGVPMALAMLAGMQLEVFTTLFSLVPLAGLEPARCFHHLILSQAR
jgi:hypothetical protein